MWPSIAFTVVSLVAGVASSLISLILFLILAVHLIKNRDVGLLLLANTYASICALSTMGLSVAVKVMKADLYGSIRPTADELVTCRLQGFFLYELFGCAYTTFILQATYRFARVVYPKHKRLQVCIASLVAIVLLSSSSFLDRHSILTWSVSYFSG